MVVDSRQDRMLFFVDRTEFGTPFFVATALAINASFD